MLLRFSPPLSSGFYKKLGPQDASLAKYYPSAVTLFKGSINLERFEAALEKTFQLIDFLFCRLSLVGCDVCAKYVAGDDKYSIQVEVEYSEISLAVASKDNLFLMPQLVDQRILKVDGTFDGLPMISLKLTQLVDGFALAYYFNHCFMDQSSMVFLLKTLCNYYNQKIEQIKQPLLIDATASLELVDTFWYDDIQDFRNDALRLMNKVYYADLSQLKLAKSYFSKLVPCQLIFNEKKLSSFKASASSYISTNDIINAILMKINVNDKALQEYSSCELGFAYNLRQHLNLTDAHLGNIFTVVLINQIERSQIRALSLLELSRQIRAIISLHDSANFSNSLNWLHNFVQNGENFNNYVSKFLVDPCSIISSNWSSFDYSQVKFDESVIQAIVQPLTLQSPYATVINFNNLIEKNITLNITLPESALTYARYLSESSGLFIIAH